jgi:hypothetical protein
METKNIKNYVVNIRKNTIDNFENFVMNYLENDTHKNHSKHNTQFFNSFDKVEYITIQKRKLLKNQELHKNKKGRKLKVISKSLTFNIPKTFEINEKELKEIEESLISEIIKLYDSKNVKIERNELYSIIHKQENSHLHMLLPSLDVNGKNLRFLIEKSFLNELKYIFTKIVDKTLNKDISNYQTQDIETRLKTKIEEDLEEQVDYYYKLLENDDNDKKTIRYLLNQVKSINRLQKDLYKREHKEVEREYIKFSNNFNKVKKNQTKKKKKTTTTIK